MFLIIWWLTPSFLKLFTQASFEEIQAPIWLATDRLETIANNAVNKTKSKQELIDTISELKRQNAYYKQITNINENYNAEITRLESILNLPRRDHFRYELAHVIQRNMEVGGKLYELTKVLSMVFKKVMPLFLLAGLLACRKDKLLYKPSGLLSNHSFRISASFINDDRPLFYQGKGTDLWGQPKGRIKNAPQDLKTDSAQPLQLVTTGLGGTFPEGITIGRVPWLEPDNPGMFQAGEVQLDKRLLGIKEVAVLIPYNRIESIDHDF